MMKIHDFIFNLFGEKTYLVWDDTTGDAMVIDPGMSTERERITFDDFIARYGLKLRHMVNTHMHLDHSWGNDYVKQAYGVNTEANNADSMLARRRAEQAQMFGMRGSTIGPLDIDVDLKQGDVVKVGSLNFHVLQVPGHSPGSIALYEPEQGVAFVGDALFEGSIGRTDLPGGSYPQLIEAICSQLLTLPDDTVVYSGHGDPTTIGREKAANPYLKA